MNRIIVNRAEIAGWNGFILKAGPVSLGLAPEIGGRIISLKYDGEELLFVREERRGERPDLKTNDLAALKRKIGWGLWGGDKTWVAPQDAWLEGTPPVDLDAGHYEAHIDGNAVVMTSPVCRETGLEITRRVELKENGEIALDQEFQNLSNREISFGIWDVTQFLRPFEIILPAAVSCMRPYAQEKDSAELFKKLVSERDGQTTVRCDKPLQFKFGALYDKGEVIMQRRDSRGILTHRRIFDVDMRAKYAHDATVEIFNSSDFNYFELEVHAPMKKLGPQESTSHRQIWQFKKN